MPNHCSPLLLPLLRVVLPDLPRRPLRMLRRRRVTTAADRKRQAQIAATLAEQINQHLKPAGPTSPCGFCGDTTLGQRHRVIDAIAEQIRAGEHPDTVADDYGITLYGIIYALAVSW